MGSRQRTTTNSEPGRTPRRNMSKPQQAEAGTAMAKRYRESDKPSIKQIADEFGVSYGTAYRLMKAAGVELRPHGGVRHRQPWTARAIAGAAGARGSSQAGIRA
jgi:hypothetical protein